MATREIILHRLIALLKGNGFEVSGFLHSHSCFDLAARGSGLTILLKVFNNIDAMHAEQAAELKKLSNVLNANAFVVGEKSKVFRLQNDVVYERYGLPVLTLESFSALLDRKLPRARYFKGKKIVKLDNELLKKRRMELGLTLSDLAEKIGSTTESINRYEKGKSTSIETAERLEDALDASLVKRINLFEERLHALEFDDEPNDSALEKMHGLGIKLALFEHAPFKAVSRPHDSLLINKGLGKRDIQRKAIALGKSRAVIKGDSMIIARESKYVSVKGTPVIEEEELDSMSKSAELIRLVKKREKIENGK